MPTHKKFFMYAVWVILFFIFSQILIYVALNTTYSYKKIEVNSTLVSEASVKTNSVSGIAKIKINNNTQNAIENKYIKIDCYSKHDVLMGTKYIQTGKILTNEEKEFEVIFNYNKVEYVKIEVIDNLPQDVPQTSKISDKKLTLALAIGALALLFIYG